MAKHTKARIFYDNRIKYPEQYNHMLTDVDKVSDAKDRPEGSITSTEFKNKWGFSVSVGKKMKNGTYGQDNVSSPIDFCSLVFRHCKIVFKKRTFMVGEDTYKKLQETFNKYPAMKNQYVLDAILRKGMGINDREENQ